MPGETEKEKKNWLSTIPGAVATTTAFMTAASGFLVAIHQINNTKSPTTSPASITSPVSPATSSDAVALPNQSTSAEKLPITEPETEKKGKGKKIRSR